MPTPPEPSRMVVQPVRSPLEQAVRAPLSPAPPAPLAEDAVEAADREALIRVGCWPPPQPQPESWFWRTDDHWPRDWTLTRYDRAIFLGSLGVSQRALAGQLGVPKVEVSRAEAKPIKELRSALQVSMKEEMERARPARRLTDAAPTQEKGAEPAVQAESVVAAPAEAVTVAQADSPPVPPDARRAPEAPTGADLARWRLAASLSRRQAAAQLGVAPGTVAKAKHALEKALGEQLNRTLREAKRGQVREATGSASS